MEKKLLTLNTTNRISHILHLAAIAACIIASIVNYTLISGIVTIIVSITYVQLLCSNSRKCKMLVKKNESEDAVKCSDTALNDDMKQITSTMKGKVTVIPVLTEQLRAVISQTDTAAEGLIAAFLGINQQSKKQFQSVKELFGNLSEKSGGNTLSETQQKLQELQQNFSTMTSFLDRSIVMIENVVDQLSRVEQFASKIKKIGQMTNILAINAAIEAAQSGDAGNGFKVIASEINALSKDSTDSIKEITGITENLTSNVITIKRELESVHKDSMDIEKRTDSLLGVALQQIDETLRDATEKIKTIAGNAEELNKEIGRVVVSIQFQDITRQRIEHVIAPLETLQNEITDILQKIDDDEKLSIHTQLHSEDSELMKQYTMESEREILRNFQKKSS
jgi:methyl-accepting chemotaxis protein